MQKTWSQQPTGRGSGSGGLAARRRLARGSRPFSFLVLTRHVDSWQWPSSGDPAVKRGGSQPGTPEHQTIERPGRVKPCQGPRQAPCQGGEVYPGPVDRRQLRHPRSKQSQSANWPVTGREAHRGLGRRPCRGRQLRGSTPVGLWTGRRGQDGRLPCARLCRRRSAGWR